MPSGLGAERTERSPVEKEGSVMTLKLEVDGESIKGEVRRENDDGPADVGLVSLKRVKD